MSLACVSEEAVSQSLDSGVPQEMEGDKVVHGCHDLWESDTELCYVLRRKFPLCREAPTEGILFRAIGNKDRNPSARMRLLQDVSAVLGLEMLQPGLPFGFWLGFGFLVNFKRLMFDLVGYTFRAPLWYRKLQRPFESVEPLSREGLA